MKEEYPLKMIDLFSGIGGFSWSFRTIFDTIGYCDISPYCRRIIRNNIQRGLLREAPIIEDVREIERWSFDGDIPCVVTGGFPCQDVSTANVNSIGIKGERTGMFHEIIRVIRLFPEVKHVILENVPRLMNMGYNVVCSELESLGFQLRKCIVSARQLGAHHNRKRLFIVASKSFSHLRENSSNLSHYFSWEGTSPPRLIRCTDKNERKAIRERCGACGNAIVPYCAVMSLRHLVFEEILPNNKIYLDLVLVDGRKRYKKEVWATPCACVRRYYKYKNLSKRSTTVLYNQLFYDRDNTKSNDTHTINPQFVEWMMGYPPDYTLNTPGETRVTLPLSTSSA